MEKRERRTPTTAVLVARNLTVAQSFRGAGSPEEVARISFEASYWLTTSYPSSSVIPQKRCETRPSLSSKLFSLLAKDEARRGSEPSILAIDLTCRAKPTINRHDLQAWGGELREKKPHRILGECYGICELRLFICDVREA